MIMCIDLPATQTTFHSILLNCYAYVLHNAPIQSKYRNNVHVDRVWLVSVYEDGALMKYATGLNTPL